MTEIKVQGYFSNSAAGVTNGSKAKLEPYTGKLTPLFEKALSLLIDTIHDIKEHICGKDENFQHLVGDESQGD